MVLALGALVSAAANPVSAQVVVGESRPSVEVNWDVLNKLGPEPTVPSLLIRQPQPSAPARNAASAQGVVYKPFQAEAHAQPKPKAAKVAKVVVDKDLPAAAEPPIVKAKPAPAKIAEPPPVAAPVAEDKPTRPAPAPAKPDKVDLVDSVPPPVKVPSEPKVKSSVVTPPAPVVEAPKPPVAVVEAPKPAPAPVVEAPKPVPPAVQFVKAPEPVAPPAPVVAAPAPVVVTPPAPAPVPVVIAPPPAPVPVLQPAPAPPQQLAAAPSSVGGSVRKGDNVTILFADDSSHLPDSVRGDLERVAQKLEKDEGLSLQLMAYAAGDEANASKARRLSLSRALEVRKYLMEMGVRSTRIEVRALGNKVEGGPADRVDTLLVSR